MTAVTGAPVVTCTLLADGSSDQVLLPILQWLLDNHCDSTTRLRFADQLQTVSRGLPERISAALVLYPCHVLFVHRDAERGEPATRRQEVEQAWHTVERTPRLVTIVPVRMTEAWLLVDAAAIRTAAGNPNGRVRLDMPDVDRLEQLPDPKATLFELLARASELGPHRLQHFSPESRRHRIPEVMAGFERLRALPSFVHLETQVQQLFLA